ncbi:hypothetical protein [Aliikangiella sp. G2MR2-5]|uniref:hypothetical protein n=1 Tax=Aliikangiella sp. G2MR2-5 TaxID=2788943 RepID=UPI0018A9904B|nr:hypothetical protein [Aliikangiella sp. G2MR2-5]
MNTEKTQENKSDIEVPLFIRGALIFVAVAINLPVLFSDFNLSNITSFIFLVTKNLVLLPGVFLIVGILLRLRDDTFRLSNSYYLGVLMAIVLTVQSIRGE